MPRSSIFSSEYVAALRRVPLRIYAWHALVVLVMVAVALGASAALTPLNKRFQRPKPPYLRTGEVMVLGDSRLLYLNTWDYPVRNFALPTTGYRTHLSLFEANAPEMPHLKVLVIPLSFLDFYKLDIEGHEGDYRDLTDWGVPWYRIPGVSFPKRLAYFARYNNLAAPFFIGPKFDITTFRRISLFPLELLPDTDKERNFDEPGGVMPMPKEAALRPMQSIVLAAQSNTDIAQAAPQSTNPTFVTYRSKWLPYIKLTEKEPPLHHEQALFKLIAYCRSKDIQPVFITVPAPGGLLREFDGPARRVEELLAKVNSRFPDSPIPIWDAEREDGIYEVDQFQDHFHLNKAGLARFNAYLNAKLVGFTVDGAITPLLESFRRSHNLLPSAGPFEQPLMWRGSPNVAYDPIEAPRTLRKFAERASRITLPPGGSLYQVTEGPVAAGSTVQAQAWIWGDTAARTSGLKVIVARHDESAYEGGVAEVHEISATPTQVTALGAFANAHKRIRFELRNDGAQPVTFCFAAPSLQHQYTSELLAYSFSQN